MEENKIPSSVVRYWIEKSKKQEAFIEKQERRIVSLQAMLAGVAAGVLLSLLLRILL